MLRFCGQATVASLLAAAFVVPGRDAAAAGMAANATAMTAGQRTLPQPVTLPPIAAERPVLRVGHGAAARDYSLSMLERLGLYEVATDSFWPDDDGIYEGVLLADLLKDAGLADAAAIRITAADGFSQDLPRTDWTRWPLLLATRRDGKPLARREKGPTRIIYPRSADEALKDPVYRLRWVWLVRSIEPVGPGGVPAGRP
jgi:hypothetical protein